jgi:hypothetical protein
VADAVLLARGVDDLNRYRRLIRKLPAG